MERIEQPKTAVPLEVQLVLDAMTEDNWRQDGRVLADGKACFMNRAAMMECDAPYDMVCGNPKLDFLDDVYARCKRMHGVDLPDLNDSAPSLSDFKSKIIALYQEAT